MKLLIEIWPYIVAALTMFITVVASGHAVIYKRDSRSAVFWTGVIWMVPIFGAIIYLLLGINRIRRSATALLGSFERCEAKACVVPQTPEKMAADLGEEAQHLETLAKLVNNVVHRPLLPGNKIEPLINGDEAFPEMLKAIAEAKHSIALCTYIFDRVSIGRKFLDALSDALKRGVDVRVIVDATGARYSFPTIIPLLKEAGIPYARFIPVFPPVAPKSINLRNHRKILVVDGRLGFTGGMNIRPGNLVKENPPHPVQDVHFKVQGPVVAHLLASFVDDWRFCGKSEIKGDGWFPVLEPEGNISARGICDGPDDNLNKLINVIQGALSCAQRKVTIVTPYFLPDQTLISALNTAAMRGVQIDIVLPEKNNLPFVQWATFATVWQLLEKGCNIHLTKPPFDHTKIMLLDGHWALIGSANWDARSLRLNFEFNVECYEKEFTSKLESIIDRKLETSRPLTLEEVNKRSLPVKIRDGIARLFTPFL